MGPNNGSYKNKIEHINQVGGAIRQGGLLFLALPIPKEKGSDKMIELVGDKKYPQFLCWILASLYDAGHLMYISCKNITKAVKNIKSTWKFIFSSTVPHTMLSKHGIYFLFTNTC